MKLNITQFVTYIRDSFDNIRSEETSVIKSKLLKKDRPTAQQIITIVNVVFTQNCFTFLNKIYRTDKEISMGSHIAEILLQHTEGILRTTQKLSR
jgi:hypothetical protein